MIRIYLISELIKYFPNRGGGWWLAGRVSCSLQLSAMFWFCTLRARQNVSRWSAKKPSPLVAAFHRHLLGRVVRSGVGGCVWVNRKKYDRIKMCVGFVPTGLVVFICDHISARIDTTTTTTSSGTISGGALFCSLFVRSFFLCYDL